MANSTSGDSMLDRVVRILETFSEERTVQTASEISRRACLPSSTAHRLTDDLVAAGLLERDDEHRLRLGMHLWELALRGSTALRLRQAALPHMEAVQAEIREHTQLAVLEQEEALFLERLSHPEAGGRTLRAWRVGSPCTLPPQASYCSRSQTLRCANTYSPCRYARWAQALSLTPPSSRASSRRFGARAM